MRRSTLARAVGPGATITVAGMVGVLGVIGQVSPELVSAATLAVLATVSAELVASWRWSSAADRALRRLTTTVEAQARPSMDRTVRHAAPGAWAVDASHARQICLVGVTLARTVRTTVPELERCLASGGTVQVAVTDPGDDRNDAGSGDGPLREASRRHGLADDGDVFRHRLGTTVDTIDLLSRSARGRGRLEVRFLPFVPNVSLALVDPEGPDGRCNVDVYAHRPGAHEPCLALSRRTDPRWFAHFVAEFDRIWDAGRPSPGLPLRPAAPPSTMEVGA